MLKWLTGFDQRLKNKPILHKALYQQLEYAIQQGILRTGEQLPPHRKLAKHLGIAVATVTKVYRYAEDQGLLYARVGKGSFVSVCQVLPQAIRAQDYQSINLSIIKPLVAIGETQLAEQLNAMCEQAQLSDLMDYNPEGGSLTDLHTAREWLSQQGVSLDNKEISICSGAQHGLMLLINSITQHGDCIAVENFCYPGIISLANQHGRKLIGIAMDEQGIIPDALELACQAHDIKMLIVVASHQNPTTAVMSKVRRKAIAKIVEKYSIWLVDDDVYGFLSPHLPPISNYAAEHSFYLTSLSKSMFPGLRVGYLVSPQGFKKRVDAEVRNSIWMPVPFTLALASRLIYSGQARDIQLQQTQLAERRQNIARHIFSGCHYQAQPNSYHLWLNLPSPWSSEEFSLQLKQQGILVSSADYFCAEHQTHTAAVRISLMAVKSEDALKFGLKRVRSLLSRAPN